MGTLLIFEFSSVLLNRSPFKIFHSVLCFTAFVSTFFQSEAQELTIVKMSKFGGGIGAPSKEERLKEAAEIHLRLGQIQRYCELMVELGQVRSVCVSISCVGLHPVLALLIFNMFMIIDWLCSDLLFD